MMACGAADKMMKALNRMEVPAQLFVIFTPGGHDFVGGYTFYEFLKNCFDAKGNALAGKSLGKMNLPDGFKTGEEIH